MTKYMDILCAFGVALCVYFHHILVAGWKTRFEIHPAIVAIFIFFSVFGAYRLVFGPRRDKEE